MSGTRFFALTGLPRSGTTYLAAVLHHPPAVVALSEARGLWRSLYREEGPDADVLDVFERHRARIAAGEPVATIDGTPGFRGETRVDTWTQKKADRPIDVAPDFVLGMKNPEVFLEWLPRFEELETPCVVTVRHPVSVINSWVRRVRRRVEAGRSLEGTFANGSSVAFRSSAIDIVDRRIELVNHMAGRIAAAQDSNQVLVVRHEDWYRDPGQLKRVADFLKIPCRERLLPPPIPPDPPILDAEEIERICSGCRGMAAFGYPLSGGVLTAPESTGGVWVDDRRPGTR